MPEKTATLTPSICRGCRQPIQWRQTASGKNMPLDLEPTTDTGIGVYVLVMDRMCRPFDARIDDPERTPRYMNHWATCPQAKHFRTRKVNP